MNDGFGNLIASCREYTQSRIHRNCEVKLWIQKNTEIGPVRDAKIICHHGRPEIENQPPSPSGDHTNVWVVISRGQNRFVDELRYRDPYFLLQKLLTNACRTRIKSNRLLNWICQTITFQFLNGNNGYTWESQIPKVVGKLVPHENYRDRETGGAIHWKLIRPEGTEFTDRDWINYIWRGSNKTRFQYCQNSCDKLLYIRAIQGHTGGEMIELEMSVLSFHPTNVHSI